MMITTMWNGMKTLRNSISWANYPYQKWIHVSNAIILISVTMFFVMARDVVKNRHFTILPISIRDDPSLIYAYIVLVLQAGVIQIIGLWAVLIVPPSRTSCSSNDATSVIDVPYDPESYDAGYETGRGSSALRAMNKRRRVARFHSAVVSLKLYCGILAVLLVGDIIIGLIWVYRLHCLSRYQPSSDTGNVRSYSDTSGTFRYSTTASYLYVPWIDAMRRNFELRYGPDDPHFTKAWNALQVEYQCCGLRRPTDFVNTNWFNRTRTSLVIDKRNFNGYQGPIELVPLSCCSMKGNGPCQTYDYQGANIYHSGCSVYLRAWVVSVAYTMYFVGYCMISLIKAIFLSIIWRECSSFEQRLKAAITGMAYRNDSDEDGEDTPSLLSSNSYLNKQQENDDHYRYTDKGSKFAGYHVLKNILYRLAGVSQTKPRTRKRLYGDSYTDNDNPYKPDLSVNKSDNREDESDNESYLGSDQPMENHTNECETTFSPGHQAILVNNYGQGLMMKPKIFQTINPIINNNNNEEVSISQLRGNKLGAAQILKHKEVIQPSYPSPERIVATSPRAEVEGCLDMERYVSVEDINDRSTPSGSGTKALKMAPNGSHCINGRYPTTSNHSVPPKHINYHAANTYQIPPGHQELYSTRSELHYPMGPNQFYAPSPYMYPPHPSHFYNYMVRPQPYATPNYSYLPYYQRHNNHAPPPIYLNTSLPPEPYPCYGPTKNISPFTQEHQRLGTNNNKLARTYSLRHPNRPKIGRETHARNKRRVR